MAPTAGMAADAEEEVAAAAQHDASEKIREEQEQIGRVQAWWSEGVARSQVTRSATLSAIDEALLSELIAAGGGYHTILTADRLDGMHRRLGSSTEPALEPLRRALQTRGGAKSQARVVGMLVFKEARSLYEQSGWVERCLDQARGVSGLLSTAAPAVPPAAAAAGAQGGGPEAAAGGAADDSPAVKLEEKWSPPRRYVCADSYPQGAQMAVRSAPNQKGEIIATVPEGTEYMATGRVGEYLQVAVTQNGVASYAYVLHSLGELVLLVQAPPAPPAAAGQPAGAAPAASSPSGSSAARDAVGLDEVFSPARRYVCAETYPAGAQMAVRSAPSRDGQQVATLPPGAEYLATGRVGDYLQISLEVDGARTTAYALHSMGDLTLLVPEASGQETPAAAAAAAAVAAAEAAQVAAAAAKAASEGRVEALEAKVAQQDRQLQVQDSQIQSLQNELAMLKAQLGAVATAFRPLAVAGA